VDVRDPVVARDSRRAGGSGGIDDAVLRLHDPGIGAEIMGAGKFGYLGWHEDPAWKGRWVTSRETKSLNPLN
jgi:hypothetical protein